jgi:hypothetical protein
MVIRLRAGLIALFFAALPPGAAAQAAQPAAPLRVLFIGNSLTSANDLPGMVAAMPCFADGRTIDIHTVTLPDMSLADHYKKAAARSVLKSNRYDLVILQQGPSSLPASRKELLDSVRRFAPEIKAAGARPAMLSVWPSWQRRSDFDAVTESYRLAAEAIDALVLPMGEAWRAAWRRDPGLPLYSGDEVHPSPLGSYLGALVICSALGGRPPSQLSGVIDVKGKPLVLPKSHVDVVVLSAAEALTRFPVARSTAQEKK